MTVTYCFNIFRDLMDTQSAFRTFVYLFIQIIKFRKLKNIISILEWKSIQIHTI